MCNLNFLVSAVWIKWGHININNTNFLACSHTWKATDSHFSFPWPTPQGLWSSQLFLGGPRVSLSSCLFRNECTLPFLSRLFERVHWPGHWEQHFSTATADDVFRDCWLPATLPHFSPGPPERDHFIPWNMERLVLSAAQFAHPNLTKVLVIQSHPALCNPMDYSWSSSSVYGIFQARILEWVAIPFSSWR